MEWATNVFLLLLLIRLCRQDLNSLAIDGRFLMMPLVLGLLNHIPVFRSGDGAGELLLAVLPGISLEIFAWFSRESVGEGDALLIWSLGFLLPFDRIYRLLFSGFWLAAAGGTVLLWCEWKSLEKVREQLGTRRFPLMPALLAVYLMELGSTIGK